MTIEKCPTCNTPLVLDTTHAGQPMIDRAAGERRVSLKPISTDEWMLLPEREQQLSAIADSIAYWIKWAIKDFEAGSIEVHDDLHVMLDGDNAPPHWPSIGVLTHWLAALRPAPPSGDQQ